MCVGAVSLCDQKSFTGFILPIFAILSQMKTIQKIVRSITFALRGLYFAYRHDKSFALEIVLGLPVYLLIGWYLFPFAPWEIVVYVLSYLLILLVELMNTAFEKMLDRVHPDVHPLTQASKDVASASVLIAFIFAAIVIVVLVWSRLAHGDDGLLRERPFIFWG
jgi:diacylglycerol kinase